MNTSLENIPYLTLENVGVNNDEVDEAELIDVRMGYDAPDGILNEGNTCYASAAIQIYQKMCQVCCIPTGNIDTKNFKNEQSDSCEALRLLLELAGGKQY
jgi:hypothetical protein